MPSAAAADRQRPVWIRRAWCDEADAALGGLIAPGRAEMLALLDRGFVNGGGYAQLYQVAGVRYEAWILIRFAEDDSGLGIEVVAFAGHGVESALPDLRHLGAAVGVQWIDCSTESEAVARLYRLNGFRVKETFFRMTL